MREISTRQRIDYFTVPRALWRLVKGACSAERSRRMTWLRKAAVSTGVKRRSL
jgi:hypothetical protein